MTTSIFDEATWKVERAILFVCSDLDPSVLADESLPLASAIGDWLRDSTRPPLGKDAKARAHAIAFVKKLRELYGENINAVEMLPTCWAWFALSKARPAASTAFRNAFELWVTSQILKGNLPVLQRMQKQAWKEIKLDGNRLSFATGVPVATLGTRSFDKSCNSDAWRLKMYPLVTDQANADTESDQEPAKKLSAKNISTSNVPDGTRSLHCEKALAKALGKLSRLQKIPITEVNAPTAHGIRFEASSLGREDLLALVTDKEPALARTYGEETVRRSLSFVIRSRLGRPPKSAEVPKKVTGVKFKIVKLKSVRSAKRRR